MTITAALVLFAMIWFLALFIALPMRLTTQGEAGHVVPGTPSSAPVATGLRRKLKWVTVGAFAVWVPVSAVILADVISVRDLDFLAPYARPEADGTDG